MTGLLLAQLAHRWGQALTLLALSLAATVAAVSAPVYAVAIGRAAAEHQVAIADNAERVVSLPLVQIDDAAAANGLTVTGASEQLGAYDRARATLTGFEPLTTAEITVQGLGPGPTHSDPRRLVARDGWCQHVRLTAGRCPVGSREVALPASLTASSKVTAGQELTLTPIRQVKDGWRPDGPPTALTVVGVYRASDPDDAYWVPEDPLGRQGFTPAILTNRTALRTMPHAQEADSLDAIAPPSLITPERVPVLRHQLASAEQRLKQSDPDGTGLGTDLPRLLDRITADTAQASALLPIAAAPLVGLCWFVVYLAVGHGVSGRRHEVGAVALHGARWRTRAVAFGGESLLPVLAGVPVGLVLAHPLVALVAPADVGGIGFDRAQLIAAGLAAVGTLGGALLALRRELTAPVVQLLRQVPSRAPRVSVAAIEVLAVVIGIVAVVDLQTLGGRLDGVMVAAPVLVMLAVAVLAIAAVRPIVGLGGRWSLRRGRLAPAMAALYLARRPGSARLLVVLALVFGTFGFALTTTDVAATGRVAQTQRSLGAARVLHVEPVDVADLLEAVRASDPSGRYAMAAVSVSGTDSSSGTDDSPPVIAVDSTRLARTAIWSDRYDSNPNRAGSDHPLDPAKLAALLHPPGPDPVMITDGKLTADLTIDPLTTDDTLSLALVLAPRSGDREEVVFGPVSSRHRTYTATIASCPDGCRLAGITVSTSDSSANKLGVTLHSLRRGDRDVLPAAWLSHADRWHRLEDQPVPQQLYADALGDGLMLTQRFPKTGEEYEVLPTDTPSPLPVVTAGHVSGNVLTNIDDHPLRVSPKARIAGLPGVSGSGAMMDLEYAERLTTGAVLARDPQVWLARDTPARIVDELRRHGLVVTTDQTLESVQSSIDASGAALALRFFRFSAGLAILVGLGALALVVGVDRDTWAVGLGALRTQGMAGRTARSISIWSYGGIVVVGALTGFAAAAGAWFAVRGQLPLGVDASLLDAWPRWLEVAAPWTLVVLVLVGAAVVGARWQQAGRGRAGRGEAGRGEGRR